MQQHRQKNPCSMIFIVHVDNLRRLKAFGFTRTKAKMDTAEWRKHAEVLLPL